MSQLKIASFTCLIQKHGHHSSEEKCKDQESFMMDAKILRAKELGFRGKTKAVYRVHQQAFPSRGKALSLGSVHAIQNALALLLPVLLGDPTIGRSSLHQTSQNGAAKKHHVLALWWILDPDF